MNKRQDHTKDKILGMRRIISFSSATITFLLLINTHQFDFIAVAQRTTPRSNETQSANEESTSATSQNLESGVANTPTTVNTPTINTPRAPCQISSNLGSSGQDLMSGTPSNDLIIGLQGADTIKGNDGLDVIQGDEDPDKL